MLKYFCLFAFLSLTMSSNAQPENYTYRRPLAAPTADWHSIALPDDIFTKVKSDFSDLRIYGVNAAGDSLEAPYIFASQFSNSSTKKFNIERINTVKNAEGFYYTFALPEDETVNRIDLDFGQENFDFRVDLAGSQDGKNWFTAVENYRMVGIRNERTDYDFTELIFAPLQYRYLRLLVKTDTDPKLKNQTVEMREETEGEYRNYAVKSMKVNNLKQEKQTEIIVKLPAPVPVSKLKIDFADKTDFYRNVKIQYLADSFLVNDSWKYTYNTLAVGTVSSLEKNRFEFKNSPVSDELKITVSNNDNAPLTPEKVEISGVVYRLQTRFPAPADYALYYGNAAARQPVYDLVRFANKMPEDITDLALGKEEVLQTPEEKTDKSLLQNKAWLWVILLLIIGALAWFAVKMLRTEPA